MERVVFAAELPICECCGEEPFCPTHDMHFADCPCIGPTEDNVEYVERDGVLYGERIAGGQDDAELYPFP